MNAPSTTIDATDRSQRAPWYRVAVVRTLVALTLIGLAMTLVAGGHPALAQVRLIITVSATPGTVPVGQPVTVNYSVVDPNPGQQIRGGIFIDFGDGSSQQQPPAQTIGSVVHTYVNTGTYAITVSASNIGMISGSGTTTVTVTPGGIAPSPIAPAVSGCTWTGLWDTGIYGQVNLIQNGNQVTGSYALYPGIGSPLIQGTLTGTIQGSTLTGTWSQAPTYVGQDSGAFIFNLSSPCNQLSGQWRSSTTPAGQWDGPWNGTRLL